MNPVTQSEPLDKYVSELIDQKGFPDMSPEVKDELKKDLLKRVDDFMSARIIAALSDADVATFETMLKEGKGSEEVQTFVSSHIPDFTNFVANILLEFKALYLGKFEDRPKSAQSPNQPVSETPSVVPPPPAPVPEKSVN